MEQGSSPEYIRRKTLTERFVRPILDRFQRLKEERASSFNSQNPFGFTAPDFRDTDEQKKRELWVTQGGKEFKGEVGEVRRYVIGVKPEAVDQIKENGFDPEKKRIGYTAILPHFIGGTEGKGVYTTTNPTMASREYGPSLIVADVALGKVATPDKNRVLRLLNQIHEPVRWSQALYNATAMVWGTTAFLAGESVVSPQAAVAIHTASLGIYLTQGFYFRLFQELSGVDSMIIQPMAFPSVFNTIKQIVKGKQPAEDFVKKIQQHKEWVVVKNPDRVKIVGTYPNLEDYKEHEPELVKH